MIFRRFLISALLLMAAGVSRAEGVDSLIVYAGADGWELVHRVAHGETLFAISRRYSVPPTVLADKNGLGYADVPVQAGLITIPLGSYNMLTAPPLNADSSRAIYFRFIAGDKMSRISHMAGVSPQTLLQWNRLTPGTALVGKTILVGWLRWSAPTMTAISPVPASIRLDTAKYVFQPVDTVMAPAKVDTPVTLKQLWHEQTLDGENMVTEKGSAGFFSINIKSRGASQYAFHNAAARGTVIRVRNLNNGRTIYVKVSGPLPDSKQYSGCIIGLSNGAKAALGAQETKAFCELSYAGY